MPDSNKKIIIIMGVSGCGKSTIGKALSDVIKLPFYDGDDFHPASNIKKMSKGQPLTDVDRKEWLRTLGSKIKEWKNTTGAILACSALKERYRKTLSTVKGIEWVLLEVDKALIQARFNQRNEHFMPAELIGSQFNTLEVPKYGLKVNAALPISAIINSITDHLNKKDD